MRTRGVGDSRGGAQFPIPACVLPDFLSSLEERLSFAGRGGRGWKAQPLRPDGGRRHVEQSSEHSDVTSVKYRNENIGQRVTPVCANSGENSTASVIPAAWLVTVHNPHSIRIYSCPFPLGITALNVTLRCLYSPSCPFHTSPGKVPQDRC